MTEETVIEILKEEIATYKYNLYESPRSEYLGQATRSIYEERISALEMAIKALEQEQKTDTWSIKEVAKALEKHGFGRLEQEPKEIYAKGYTDGQRALAEHIELCKEEQEPKTGHWILDETDNSITCDKCGCLIWANDIHNGEAYYCPNCGAKMEG